MNYNELLVLFLITFVVTVLFTFFIRKILLNAGIADNPIVSEHRHKKGTPTMGGIAFLFAILFVLAIFFHNGLVFITAFMMVVAAIAGWIDDLIGLKVKEVQKVVKNITDKPVQIGQLSLQPNHEARVATPKAKEDFPKLLEENSVEVIAEVPIKTEIGEGEKIAIQLIIGIFLLLTGSVLVLGGFYLGPIFNIGTISFGIIAIPVVLIAIIGAINAVNLIDGMDGLAAGIMAIASFSSIVFLFITGNIEKAMPFIILTALCLGFLVFNKRPAKIFMGDVGSFALGAGYATAVLVTDIPYFGVLALAVPIVSVIVSLIYRAGLIKLPVEPLHHTLNHYGWSEAKITNVYWLSTAVVCVIGLLVTYFLF